MQLLAPTASPMRLETDRCDGRSYRRVYRFAPGRSGVWVQTVTVAIQYRVGACAVIEYRARYHEFFAVAGDAERAQVLDVHDFDVRRHGWSQAGIRAWFDGMCHSRNSMPDGEPELRLRKRFVLRPAAVDGAAPFEVAPGVQFGFLADGPGGPTALRLRLFGAPVAPPPGMGAVPGSRQEAGVAHAVPGPVFGTLESFRHRFACLSGVLRGRDGYRVIPCNATAGRGVAVPRGAHG